MLYPRLPLCARMYDESFSGRIGMVRSFIQRRLEAARRGAGKRRGRGSYAEYLATFAGMTPPPLTKRIGFTLEMVIADFLRCDHLGVASWLAGSGLVRAAEVHRRTLE
eukprot:6316237-Pyramimonas_sp.AAC.1